MHDLEKKNENEVDWSIFFFPSDMCLQRPGIFKFAAEFEGGAYRSCEKLVIRFGITLLTSVSIYIILPNFNFRA